MREGTNATEPQIPVHAHLDYSSLKWLHTPGSTATEQQGRGENTGEGPRVGRYKERAQTQSTERCTARVMIHP